ncbi:AroM family protein [Vibrio sp. AK197]|uniref:AroM family protein n=1 Tax=Vibrio olivae TaxID=1243002 RepID=A0ABV5HKB5_9VIBR
MSILRPTLGIVTIGQAPRVDLHDDLSVLLGDGVRLSEMGALDGLTLEMIEQRYPIMPGDYVLVSRMQDGQQVRIGESSLTPLLVAAVERMKRQKPDLIVVLCTGDLPEFSHDSSILVLSPKRMVQHFFSSLGDELDLTVMSPDEAQVEQTKARWRDNGYQVNCVVGSPYLEDGSRATGAMQARELKGSLMYLDCMGYSLAQCKQVSEISGKNVITPRQIIFNTVKLLLSQNS